MKERIQKLLSAAGVASRRKAETMIQAGRVRINGAPACLGDRADPREDVIEIDGVPLPPEPRKRYLLLNKPRGFVTTLSDERGRRNVAELVADCGERVYPVGRLDLNSEGLLILTNDGEFANFLTHPSHEIKKTYLIHVTGYRDGADALLRRPLMMDGAKIRPPSVRLLSVHGEVASLEVVIHEGKNRQIRRMCEAAGLSVTRLRRIAEGPIRLGDLPAGAWRDLTEEEVAALKF